jgi:hypothetical protein
MNSQGKNFIANGGIASAGRQRAWCVRCVRLLLNAALTGAVAISGVLRVSLYLRGRVHLTTVPWPGAEVIFKVPPTTLARYFMF